MKPNVRIISNVNSGLLDNVEKELTKILHRSINNWKKRIKYFRIIFVSLCLIGFVGSVYDLAFKPSWFTSVFQESLFAIVFIVLGLFYYFIFEPFLIKRINRYPKKLVEKARKLSPYQAEHEIKGDLITYFRGKNGVWKIAWFKRLKGVALHGESVTVIFKSWSSNYPGIVIIHEEPNQIKAVINCLNIGFKQIPFEKVSKKVHAD